MNSSFTRILFLIPFCLLAGCRIGASVFEGGDVISASGTRHCFEGGTCEFKIEDPNFSESFTAKPRTGFEFSKWKSGEGFLCGDSVDPTCTVSLSGDEFSEAIIALDTMVYIMPEFVCVGYCPERPDPNWRALDEAIVALEEARELVEAYVETNGVYPSVSTAFGLNTSLRVQSSMLDYIDVTDSLIEGATVHISAHVDTCVWDGSICTGIATSTAAFSLSGSTNGDGSMSWHCIPFDPRNPSSVPNGPNAIPEPYLPFNCRG